MSSVTPDLTDPEISLICDGLVQPAAMIRHLGRMGLTVRRKPNGRPLVNRAHYESVMNGSASGRPAAARGPVWSVAA